MSLTEAIDVVVARLWEEPDRFVANSVIVLLSAIVIHAASWRSWSLVRECRDYRPWVAFTSSWALLAPPIVATALLLAADAALKSEVERQPRLYTAVLMYQVTERHSIRLIHVAMLARSCLSGVAV